MGEGGAGVGGGAALGGRGGARGREGGGGDLEVGHGGRKRGCSDLSAPSLRRRNLLSIYQYLPVLRCPARPSAPASDKQRHLLVCEPLLRVRKLAQLVPHHVLRHHHRQEVLAIVHHELHPVPRRQPGLSPRAPSTHPTKLGRIVHDRALVWIGMWFSSASRKFGNATKYGPADVQPCATLPPGRATHLSTQNAPT